MNYKNTLLATAFTSAAFVLPLTSVAQELEISISNLTQGIYFTPLLIAAHDENTYAFRAGYSASEALAIQAEGGNPSPLKSLLDNAGSDTLVNPVAAEAEAGVIPQLPEGNPGFLAPGQSTSLQLVTQEGNNYLSLTAMLLPTNDGFVGLDSWKVPNQAGTYQVFLNAYDAGTEANNEVVNGGGELDVLGIPGCPGGLCGNGGTGVTNEESNTKVHIHRNTLGDNDLTAGVSDLTSHAHRWLNPVARITVTVK
jgi:hypothetical protein